MVVPIVVSPGHPWPTWALVAVAVTLGLAALALIAMSVIGLIDNIRIRKRR